MVLIWLNSFEKRPLVDNSSAQFRLLLIITGVITAKIKWLIKLRVIIIIMPCTCVSCSCALLLRYLYYYYFKLHFRGLLHLVTDCSFTPIICFNISNIYSHDFY